METINGVLQNVSSIETIVGDADLISSDSSVSITGLPATEQIDLKVVGFGSAPKATSAVYGVTRLSDDPAVPATPIALGTNNANWTTLIGGGVTTLHKHNLAYGAADVLATQAEIDQVCDGVTASVTAANLSTLTGGGTTTLHKHNLAYGAQDVTSTQAEIDQVCDGVSVNVTAANLSALTGGGSTTLHTHSHADLGNKTADDHTQYPLLAGRAGGQTLKGGTGASESLTLESTAHATKGEVVGIGNFVPSVTATYSLGEGVTPKAWTNAWLTGGVYVGGNKVVGARDTGWTAITGTAAKGGWATGTGTLDNALQTIKAIYDALAAHGLIGT